MVPSDTVRKLFRACAARATDWISTAASLSSAATASSRSACARAMAAATWLLWSATLLLTRHSADAVSAARMHDFFAPRIVPARPGLGDRTFVPFPQSVDWDRITTSGSPSEREDRRCSDLGEVIEG